MEKEIILLPNICIKSPVIVGYKGDITILKSLYINFPIEVLYEYPKFHIKSELILLKKIIPKVIIVNIENKIGTLHFFNI